MYVEGGGNQSCPLCGVYGGITSCPFRGAGDNGNGTVGGVVNGISVERRLRGLRVQHWHGGVEKWCCDALGLENGSIYASEAGYG